jgi:RNA-directed DNA polymerase
MFETRTSTVPITKEMVRAAYRKVKANHGAAGVDKESLEEFQVDLLNNLYVIWNRLSSGSYFPKALRSLPISKGKGKKRTLGIPTVSDRIAQQVIKQYLEPRLEAEFHEHSYGYRPLKSAHQALVAVQQNVRDYEWVIDMDIKCFFDEVDHELLMKALDRHVEEKWVKMYIKRWLEAPMQQPDGRLIQKEGKGTPQGGVISPLLANLFLHYVLDKWIEKNYPQVAFVRYADDLIIHCQTEAEAIELLGSIKLRLAECKLRLNDEKTKVVYCQDYRRVKKSSFGKKFDFLGFTFKPRLIPSKNRKGGMFLGYGFAISQAAQSRLIEEWKKLNFHRRSTMTIQDIANEVNKKMEGVIRYYGKFRLWELRRLMRHFSFQLVKWVLAKYSKFKGSYTKGYQWLKTVRENYPTMFYYWMVFKHVW